MALAFPLPAASSARNLRSSSDCDAANKCFSSSQLGAVSCQGAAGSSVFVTGALVIPPRRTLVRPPMMPPRFPEIRIAPFLGTRDALRVTEGKEPLRSEEMQVPAIRPTGAVFKTQAEQSGIVATERNSKFRITSYAMV